MDAVSQTPWDLPHCSLKRQGHASLPKFKGIRCLLGSPWSRSRLPQTLFPHRVASPPLSGHGDRGIRPSLLARPVLKTTNCPLLLTTAVRFCSHRDKPIRRRRDERQGFFICRVWTRPGALGRIDFEPSEKVGAPGGLFRGAGCSVRGPLGGSGASAPRAPATADAGSEYYALIMFFG